MLNVPCNDSYEDLIAQITSETTSSRLWASWLFIKTVQNTKNKIMQSVTNRPFFAQLWERGLHRSCWISGVKMAAILQLSQYCTFKMDSISTLITEPGQPVTSSRDGQLRGSLALLWVENKWSTRRRQHPTKWFWTYSKYCKLVGENVPNVFCW